MIVIYPMLTSPSVSPNVLPGIIKSIEKYILVYNADEVLRLASGSSAGKIISTGAEIVGRAAGLSDGKKHKRDLGSILSEAFPGYPQESTKQQGTQGKGKVSISVGDKGGSGPKPSLDLPRGDAISLEPTWLQVTTAKKGMQILGVKVIPFRIKSGESVATMIAHDQKLKNLSYLSTKYGRAISRVFYRLLQKLRIPMIKDKALSGDPQRDIVYASSKYRDNLILCLSQLDLENEEIFNTPRGVQKLHKLGWVSFAIADDVNRKVTFCMKEFGGVCSVVPYPFMFSSLGREHSKVYEDLEDIKRTSGPFFNMRTNRRRAFSESSMTQIDGYLKRLQE